MTKDQFCRDVAAQYVRQGLPFDPSSRQLSDMYNTYTRSNTADNTPPTIIILQGPSIVPQKPQKFYFG